IMWRGLDDMDANACIDRLRRWRLLTVSMLQVRDMPGGQPSSRHPLLWWGMNSTVFGKYSLDQCPEPHGASSRTLNACESTYVNPTGYNGPTRLASFPTDVYNVVTRFAGGHPREEEGRADEHAHHQAGFRPHCSHPLAHEVDSPWAPSTGGEVTPDGQDGKPPTRGDRAARPPLQARDAEIAIRSPQSEEREHQEELSEKRPPVASCPQGL